MDRDEVVRQLLARRKENAALRTVQAGGTLFAKWRRDTRTLIGIALGPKGQEEWDAVSYELKGRPEIVGNREQFGYTQGLDVADGVLASMIDEINNGDGLLKREQKDAADLLVNLCRRFDRVARQLRKRHDGRSTIETNDEYDAQDLLHALLRGHFEDVRDEEWTPSYANKASRTDFLLKNEKTVVEVKMMRAGYTLTKLRNELIIDIAQYATHPDCERLVCFIYDPGHMIQNPAGLADLEKQTGKLQVSVVISP